MNPAAVAAATILLAGPEATWPNVLRVACLGNAAFVLGMTLNVIRHYAKLITRTRNRVLPWHVLVIGAGFVLMTFGASLSIIERLDYPLSWRIPVFGTAFVLGNVGLWLVTLHLRYEREGMELVKGPSHCCNCLSRFSAEYCARCGTKQPKGGEKCPPPPGEESTPAASRPPP